MKSTERFGYARFRSIVDVLASLSVKHFDPAGVNVPPTLATMSLLCPSRGRPGQATQFAEAVASTAAHPERLEVLIYVDDDDESKIEYIQSLKNAMVSEPVSNLGNIDLIIDEPLNTPLINNILADRSTGEILLIANDDQKYQTDAWDSRIDEERQKYPDDIFLMWFDDGRYGGDLCTFPIVSRKWVDTLGYIEPPLFEHFNCDLWTWQIAQMIDRLHYISDVLVEHLHPDTGKSDADQTTERNLAGGRPDRDREMFARFERYRALDASLLQEAIDNYPSSGQEGQSAG